MKSINRSAPVTVEPGTIGAKSDQVSKWKLFGRSFGHCDGLYIVRSTPLLPLPVQYSWSTVQDYWQRTSGFVAQFI